MTIHMHRTMTKADKILAWFGKRRAVKIPRGMQPYDYVVPQCESFFCALFRPKGKPLPPGWIYWDDEDPVSGKTKL